MLKVENDYSSNFDFHIVRAGTHGVFPSALIEKKNKNKNKKKQIDHNLVPPIKSLSLFRSVDPKTN